MTAAPHDNQSPAEALRWQIAIWVGNKPMYTKDEQLGNIMELVTAYAATVEREAELKGRIDELKHLDSLTYSFMSLGNDFDYSYRQSAVDARLAALQGPQLDTDN